MGELSGIEWTDHTFNGWEGCQKVAPECDHCYAETRDIRFTGGTHWGPKAPRRRTSPKNWHKPIRWNAAADDFREEHGRRQRVFCASLSDIFDNAVPASWRADLWHLIAQTPNLDWLLLTKRPQNIARMLPDGWGDGWPHVWLGTSAGSQATADKNVPALLDVPAAVRFLSAEPLLGSIDLTWLPHDGDGALNSLSGAHWGWDVTDIDTAPDHRRRVTFETGPALDWVIAGGESGPDARPMHPDWARGLRDQCTAARVPFLFKQWGEWVPELDRDREDPDWRWDYARAAAHPRLRILNLEGGQGFHGERVHVMRKAGKHAAGRELDGATHTEFPK